MNSIAEFVQESFTALADKDKASAMAAYMKTEMPFYGVQKPERLPIYRQMVKQFAPANRKAYELNIRALWALPHREEKYAALEYAFMFPDFTDTKSLPLYERLIRDGAWWDFVDPLAINLVGHAFLKDRAAISKVMKKWSDDPDMWIRRSSLICQNHHKKQTDEKLLLDTCLKLAHEKEFFIRKAIGWALREYSYVAPNVVARFAEKNREKLSPLSYKEATKRLASQPGK